MAFVWPFKPLNELIEALEWQTDVIKAKSAEQRIALRNKPRRTFQMQHVLTDYNRGAAGSLFLVAQGDPSYEFELPDWTQATRVTEVLNQSAVALDFDPQYFDFGDTALIWENENKFERVTVEISSSGIVIDGLDQDYANCYIMPLWAAVSPGGFESNRIGANLNQLQASFTTTDNSDLSGSEYPQYRGQDVVDDCPVIGSGTLQDTMTWETSAFDNQQNAPYFLRQYDKPSQRLTMRWHAKTAQERWVLRRFLHSRRGKQKAFWLSTSSQDFEPVGSINGTNLNVYNNGGNITGGFSDPFDIEVKADDGTIYRRQVTAMTAGADVGYRPTWDMTLDTAINEGTRAISRVSFLRCVRFDADRIELLHRAVVGMTVQVPCIEVPLP